MLRKIVKIVGLGYFLLLFKKIKIAYRVKDGVHFLIVQTFGISRCKTIKKITGETPLRTNLKMINFTR